MTDEDTTQEEDRPREDAPNRTQEAIDEGGPSTKPLDVGGWDTPEDAELGEPA